MIVHRVTVAGEPVTIHVVEHEEDLEAFRDFIRANLKFLALDSETTGLDIYSDTFRCRVVQFGTPYESWVIPVERGPRFQEDVRLALRGVEGFVLHNAAYDLQVFEQHLGVPMEDMWAKVTDTVTLSKLIDPRPKEAGGFGHSLEELTAHFIDQQVAESIKGSMARLAREHKTTKANIWKIIDFDHPEYQTYAGMDTILAARLLRRLLPLIPQVSEQKGLVRFEHKVSEICSYVERRGFLLDVEYTQQLSARLLGEQDAWKEKAAALGCENVNSPVQVADALEARGVKILGRTDGGQRKVDKSLLNDLIAQGDELAVAITEAKKAGKWRSSWVDKFLETKDSSDRVHPNINPLQARTARMSITNPATQTLPAGDWMIRRCFLADEGHLIASVDYQAQELRVLAAMSKDRTMIQAFRDGADLHLLTAKAAFGDHITKDNKAERGYAKVVNFGRVYGGGAKTVAAQTGLDIHTAKQVVDGFDRAYPGVGALSKRLATEAGQNGFIVTPTGRRLPVDPSRSYSALNYLIQSSSRDVTCRALVKLHDAGFTPYIRLPIHDEVLASLPADKAAWGAEEIGRLMAEEMGPVTIGTDPDVGGRSWGSLYLKEEDRAACTDPYLLTA